MKVKVCGITNIEDAWLCVENGADALGFVFYEQSKRFISPEIAKKIISELPPFIFSVGIFVNENHDKINAIAKGLKLNTVQLHGDESVKVISQINYQVIKAFRIHAAFNWEIINEYKCNILLDAFSKNEYGGLGKKFNWELIPNELKSRIILSGGIDAQSLPVIINEIKPAAIDLSSSIENYPGKKDEKKVRAFFKILNELRENKC